MLVKSTGMEMEQRYKIESPLRELLFDGFFLNGEFFDCHHNMTPVGWLEENTFILNAVDGNGMPKYLNGVAGEIHNLVLTLANGTSLMIRHVGSG